MTRDSHRHVRSRTHVSRPKDPLLGRNTLLESARHEAISSAGAELPWPSSNGIESERRGQVERGYRGYCRAAEEWGRHHYEGR